MKDRPVDTRPSAPLAAFPLGSLLWALVAKPSDRGLRRNRENIHSEQVALPPGRRGQLVSGQNRPAGPWAAGNPETWYGDLA